MILGIEAAHAQKPNRTGVEEYCLQIILHLKKVIPSNVRVVLYVKKCAKSERRDTTSSVGSRHALPSPLRMGGDDGQPAPDLSQNVFGELPGNWEIKILRWPFGRLWSQFRLSWEFLFNKPDIFFAPGQLVPFFCPKNTIAMIHDSAFLVFPKVYSFIGRLYLTWMNKRIIKQSKIIITSTEFNKSELVRLYGKKLAEKVKVIPLAFDNERFNLATVIPTGILSRIGTEWRNLANVGQHPPRPPAMGDFGGPYIIFVGRLEEKKNTKGVVKAFNIVRGTGNGERGTKSNNLKLVLVGKSGVGYKEIEQEISSSPFKNDIVQLGYVSSDELPLLVSKAEAFVFPSLYEGFGIPVLEAMAAGCPVITSNLPALKEVGGEAAIYVNPNNPSEIVEAVSKVINDESLRQSLKEKGLKQVQLFSWQNTAQNTWAAIAKMA